MKKIIIRNCVTDSSHAGIKNVKEDATTYVIILFSCFQVHMQCIEIYNAQLKTSLLAFNILGSFTICKVKSKGIRIIYTDEHDYINSSTKIEHSSLNIDQFQMIATKTEMPEHISNKTDSTQITHKDIKNYFDALFPSSSSSSLFDSPCAQSYYVFIDPIWTWRPYEPDKTFGIKLEILQTSYSVSVNISNSTFKNFRTNILDSNHDVYSFLYIELNGCNNNFQNIIYIRDYIFINNTFYDLVSLISIFSLSCNATIAKRDIIKIVNCSFINNTKVTTISSNSANLDVYAEIYISGCLFQNLFPKVSSAKYSVLFITNSKFDLITTENVIELLNTQLVLKGPVIFHNITASQLIKTNSDIVIHNYIECSSVIATNLISGTEQINLKDNVFINITNNNFNGTLFHLQSSNVAYSYPLCYFQYYKEHINGMISSKNPVILIESKNNISEFFDDNIRNINCKWDPKSSYYGSNPLDIYEQSVQSIGNDHIFDTGLLCHCINGKQPNCHTNTLGPFYPGQNVKFFLALNSKATNQSSVPITVKINDKDFPHSLCIVKAMNEAEQMVNKNCTELVYNIFSENQPQCKLILYNIKHKFPTIYYVRLLKCPAGFALDDMVKRCDCDQILKSYGIVEKCNINDQTILRPPNSWISATTLNNSYTYHISLHCPFHYCLSHSSHLNFSTPNSQCQFNRSGMLCGHCQQGLSNVFSSYYCQHCSNFYLLLVIPISIVGLVLILLLFYLNLTVTDGSINAFILYANIISINTPLFFPSISNFTPSYTFISLANLDLGIQTCFYDGMDDYAKMWLQLTFPFYLIFIATSLILASRYSTTIQRLTARRALPVLATLFLLSYTKILRIVSSVLFSYSTITHLPSKHTTLVWSVDSNVTLFGLKFTILFIACIALFCILIPFNLILVFTKTLSWFNLITKFTPLIDAYRGPYEYDLYYWTGFLLIVRSVFFGISALSRNINLTLGIVLFSIIIAVHGIMCPYKSTLKNFQELLYLFNLQALYVISLYGQDTTNMTTVNVLIGIAGLQFSIVFLYHSITYMCDGVIRKKIQSCYNTLTMDHISQNQQYELNENILHCRIPEVSYNYQEYREPLICQD